MIRTPLAQTLIGGTGRFRRNFGRMALANALAQLIGVLSLPILSRLFTPEEFGVLTVYTLLHSLFIAIAHARVDWVIPAVRRQESVVRLMALGINLAGGVALVLLLVCLIAPEGISAPLGDGRGGVPIFTLLAFSVFAGALQLVWQSWYVFHGDLTAVSWSKLAQALVTFAASLALGLAGLGGMGLVLAYVAGILVAFATLYLHTGAPPRSAMTPSLRVFRIGRAYGCRLASVTALSLVSIAMTMSIAALIAIFYSQETLGLYGLVFRLATAPIALLTAALVQSFLSDAAIMVKTDPHQLRRFYLASVKRLLVFAALLSAVFLMGPFYVPVIFGGEEWGGAGYLLAATTPYLAAMIVFSPTTHLFIYGKAGWQLWCDLAALIAASLGFAFVAQLGYPAWVAVSVASMLLLLGYLLRFTLYLRANTIACANFELRVAKGGR